MSTSNMYEILEAKNQSEEETDEEVNQSEDESNLILDENTTLKQISDNYGISIEEIKRLLQVNPSYIKIKSSSIRTNSTLCINAFLKPKDDNLPWIKVSTYHDIKEVKYDAKEKTSIASRIYWILGSKLKEIWAPEKKRMVIEILDDI